MPARAPCCRRVQWAAAKAHAIYVGKERRCRLTNVAKRAEVAAKKTTTAATVFAGSRQRLLHTFNERNRNIEDSESRGGYCAPKWRYLLPLSLGFYVLARMQEFRLSQRTSPQPSLLRLVAALPLSFVLSGACKRAVAFIGWTSMPWMCELLLLLRCISEGDLL